MHACFRVVPLVRVYLSPFHGYTTFQKQDIDRINLPQSNAWYLDLEFPLLTVGVIAMHANLKTRLYGDAARAFHMESRRVLSL
jgi:hypothetical protein